MPAAFLRRSDVAFWHIAAFAALQNLGRYRTNNGQRVARRPNNSAANDPMLTFGEVVFMSGPKPGSSGHLIVATLGTSLHLDICIANDVRVVA